MYNKAKEIQERNTRVIKGFPYFVLREEKIEHYKEYIDELTQIKTNYIDYKKGAVFYTEGSSGDYVPSDLRFKIAKTLIDKEARFMFSQAPDILIHSDVVGENETKIEEEYQALVNKVLNNNKFNKYLLQSAKDCLIGKRVACLVDYSETDGILLHFYNSLQFYYETEFGTEKVTKFISFERRNKQYQNNNDDLLVNKYEIENNKVYYSCVLYTGKGLNRTVEELIGKKEIGLKYIPVQIITNEETLDDDRGVSEIESLIDYESAYSRLANGDIDSERKGMNPIRYVVDMNSQTTKNLSSGAGAFWDLKTDQNSDNTNVKVGTLSPSLNHTEPVKATLDRIKNSMYSEIDVPNINEETMVGTITSGKALKALYYPLQVRCNEKLIYWKTAIENIVKTIIDVAELNREEVIEKYMIKDLLPLQYKVEVSENFALFDDETEEKETDLQEINTNARSRKSYMKKWRGNEFETDAQIEEELLQIARENNMFDTMSINTNVQKSFEED